MVSKDVDYTGVISVDTTKKSLQTYLVVTALAYTLTRTLVSIGKRNAKIRPD